MGDGSDLGNLADELERAEQVNDTPDENSATTVTDEQTATDAPNTESTDPAEDEDSTDPHEDPAFPYVQGEMQTTIYVRSDTQDDWQDTKDFEIGRILKKQCGVRDVQGREYDDALFRIGADHPELVAKYVMEARGIDVPEDFGDE